MWGSLTPYNKALEKQMSLVKEVQNQPQLGAVLGYEHPSVVTLGVRSTPKDLLHSDEYYQSHSVEICKVNRGGEATFHNPGQLVVYPILHLPSLNLKVKDYICVLQKATIATLKKYDVKAFSEGVEPGVYTERGKIAFIGVKVSHGVCYHGLSINISNELSDFEAIQSCGVKNQKLDKLINYDTNVTPHSFFGLWFEQFLANIPQ